jgi:hypothetical protein
MCMGIIYPWNFSYPFLARMISSVDLKPIGLKSVHWIIVTFLLAGLIN